MKTILLLFLVAIPLITYSIVGTEERVSKLKILAPKELEARNFNILRYEGYERGSWCYHGGKVWYHVEEKTNPNIRYRIFCTLWNNEVHLYYAYTENINNLQVKIP